MTEIKLTKRYPHSRTEDITDAFMRGYEQGKKDGLKVGKQIVLGAFETYITADRKTEPQTEEWHDDCNTCRWHEGACTIPCCDYEPKTEPITHDDYIETENDHLEARCLNCNNAKACKEKHWEGCVYEPKDEATCETCRHWKCIAKEWQCEAYKCQGYEPKDEPQTERVETMSCQECKWWFTDSLKHGGYCQSLLYNHECRYEPEVDCSWK